MTWQVPTFYQAFAVDFDKDVDIYVDQHINKHLQSVALVHGNVGTADSDAKAFGYDTLAETLTLTSAIQGVSSTAFSESVSATNGAYWYLGIA